MENDFRRLLQRQSGDGAPGLLTLEKMHSSLLHVRTSSSKQGVCTPVLPVLVQPRVERAVRALDLLEAESVEPGVGQERNHLALRGVRRGHREFLSVHPRESVIGFAGRHLAAPSAHPFAKRPQSPVGQPTEHLERVVGPVMVAEAANDRIGLLNLDTDGEGVVAEQA